MCQRFLPFTVQCAYVPLCGYMAVCSAVDGCLGCFQFGTVFKEMTKLYFKVVVPLYNPIMERGCLCCFTYFPGTGDSFFHFSHSAKYTVTFYYSGVLCFFNDQMTKNTTFSCFYLPITCFTVKCLFKCFYYF